MEFHTYEDFRANLSITIEVMPAPNGIYVPDHPPNSYVMTVGMKALKLFVEKELKNKPDFLESLLKSTDDVNQEAAKTGFLKQLQASLPFTWSEEMVQAWLYDEANKYHAFNDANIWILEPDLVIGHTVWKNEKKACT